MPIHPCPNHLSAVAPAAAVEQQILFQRLLPLLPPFNPLPICPCPNHLSAVVPAAAVAAAVATYGSADRAPAVVRLPTPNDLRYSGSHEAVMKKPQPITAWHQHSVATCRIWWGRKCKRALALRCSGSHEAVMKKLGVAPAQRGNLQDLVG